MRRAIFSVAVALSIAVVTIGWFTAFASAALPDAMRQEAIARFIESRRGFDLKCLYTFDRFRPSVNASAPSTPSGDAADDQLLVSIPPMFEEHVGDGCPFGDMQFDPELVTSLDDGASTRQLGVHLSEDQNHDVKRPQIASNDVVPAKEFYKMATDKRHGYTFEFSYRRRVEKNQTMTLFSIGNRFGSCVDPGFRVDLISNYIVMLTYFYPVLVGYDSACYERRLFSARDQPCMMPTYRPVVEDNPVVHVVVSLDPKAGESELLARFFMKYVDPVTMEKFECRGFDARTAHDMPEYDYIQGTYRLFIGNNPRNVSSPLKRSKIAFARQYRDPDLDYRPPQERLRDMIKQKLDGLVGPRVPASLRAFAGKSMSLSFLGVPLPPINEDTPFKWIREQIDDFKTEHGDDIVNFIIKGLREKVKLDGSGTSSAANETDEQGNGSSADAPAPVFKGFYPNANGSTFDVFHFAVYYQPVRLSQVKEAFWNSWMTPTRPFMELKKTVRIHQDEEVLLDLDQLHSIFDDIQLDIVQLPELGTLMLYPNKTVLTLDNVKSFRDLPVEQQQRVYFAPNPGESNTNIKSEVFGRQLEPYSVVRFRMWRSTVGRTVNTTREGVIEIWVDPVDNAPKPRNPLTDIDVRNRQPVFLDLDGHDEGSTFSDTRSRQLGLFDGLEILGVNKTKVSSAKSSQSIKIIELPRYGLLYDRRMQNVSDQLRAADAADLNELEPYRVRREWIANRTFTTSLAYLHDTSTVEVRSGGVDTLQYQLRIGSSMAFSAPTTIKFHLPPPASMNDTSSEDDSDIIGVFQVDEDSAITIALLELEAFPEDSTIQMKVDQLPRHGKLYQHQDVESSPFSRSTTSIGLLICRDDIVTDPKSGRLVYVPDPNYFNSVPHELNRATEAKPLDSFRYYVLHGTVPVGTREVELRVVNTPDPLAMLPPTVVSTNSTRGEPVKVPVIFDDPDEFSGSYQVKLEAKDKDGVFEFGHVVTDDDVLKYCPFERPCELVRSANESYTSNENGDKDESADWQLHYTVRSRTWNPSKIEVRGSKQALEYSLQRLVFRDVSLWTWLSDHTARFDVTIERLSDGNETKTKMTYYVDFVNTHASETDSLGQALSNLADLVSMGVWVAVMCFVLSSASCFSVGFCCCCSRARREKRRQFEQKRRQYVEQVAQNNYEYSSLLTMFVEVIGRDPELHLTKRLLRLCGDPVETDRNAMQVLCLKSVAPVLDAEDRLCDLVIELVHEECSDQFSTGISAVLKYPSLASLALTDFCREKGGEWLRHLRQQILSNVIEHHNYSATQLTQALENHLDSLPKEIIRVCRKFADVVASDTDATLAIHIVFFNHFVGPELWFLTWSSRSMGRSRRYDLREAIRELTSYGWNPQPAEPFSLLGFDALARYRKLLQTIRHCSLDGHPTGGTIELDGELLGASLMNLHCILECVLPVMEKDEKDEKVRQGAYEGDAHAEVGLALQDCEDVRGELDLSPIAQVKRLLHALNFPLMSCEALVANATLTFNVDPLVCNGFSIDEWRARVDRDTAAEHAATHKRPKLRHAESLLAVEVARDADAPSTAFESSRSTNSEEVARIEFEF